MSTYKLNANILIKNEKIILLGKKAYDLGISKRNTRILNYLNELSNGIHIDNITEEKNKEFESLFHLLRKNCLVVKHLQTYKNSTLEKTYDFLSYHLSSVNDAFDFSKNIHVAIIGCGGMGANVALGLIASGVSHFTLLDYDRVQKSNLNRQHTYDTNDIGIYKTFALRNRLKSIRSDTYINCINTNIDSTDTLNLLPNSVSMIISAIDTPTILSSIFTTNFALKRNIPIVFGSVGYTTIKVGPLLNNEASKLRYLNWLKSINQTIATPISGSTSASNMFLSSQLVTNIMNYLYFEKNICQILNNEIMYDIFNLNQVRTVEYDNN